MDAVHARAATEGADRDRDDGPEPDDVALGERLLRLRLAAGLSQEKLARRSGVSVRAIRNFERGRTARTHPGTRRLLARALGLDPSAEAWLFGGDPAAPSPPAIHADRLATPLVGRQRELAEAARLLGPDGVPLLTLTGPGGVGKTRVATELAARLATRNRPARLVSLAAVADPADVLPAITATLLPDPPEGDLRAALARDLRRRHLIVVLDNLEHLLDAAPDVAWLLRAAPNLAVIVTSREPLGIAGERTLDLAPLDASSRDGDAVRLFVQQALLADPGFDPRGEELSAVREICRRVGGLPLAIELAAARMGQLSPAHLLALLDAAGLRALGDGPRDRPARQASMEAVIGWSWDLLSPEERAALEAMAVFAGGFDLAALAALLAASGDPAPAVSAADAVVSLTRKSLALRQPPEPSGAAPRWTLLEPIREFALSRLRAEGREAALRRAHAEWALARCAALDADAAAGVPGAMARLKREHPNARAALHWAEAAGDRGLATGLAMALKLLWIYQPRIGGDARPAAEEDADERLVAYVAAAERAMRTGDHALLREATDAYLAWAQEREDAVAVALAETSLTAIEPDPAAALAWLDRIAAALGPEADWAPLPFVQAYVGMRRGGELHRLGRLEAALAAMEAAIARYQRDGTRVGLPVSLIQRGLLREDLGQPRDAARDLLEAATRAAAADDAWNAYQAGRELAGLARRHGDGVPEAAAIAGVLHASLEAMREREGAEIPEADRFGPAPAGVTALPLEEALAAAAALPELLPASCPRREEPRPDLRRYA